LAPQFPYPTLTSALTAFKKSCLTMIAYLIPLAAMFFFLTRIGASSAFIEAAYAQPSRLTQTVMDAPWQTKLFVVQLLGAPVHLVTLALLGTWLASLLLAHRDQAH